MVVFSARRRGTIQVPVFPPATLPRPCKGPSPREGRYGRPPTGGAGSVRVPWSRTTRSRMTPGTVRATRAHTALAHLRHLVSCKIQERVTILDRTFGTTLPGFAGRRDFRKACRQSFTTASVSAVRYRGCDRMSPSRPLGSPSRAGRYGRSRGRYHGSARKNRASKGSPLECRHDPSSPKQILTDPSPWVFVRSSVNRSRDRRR